MPVNASITAKGIYLLTAALLAVACGPIVKGAPFRLRPESVKPGMLLGPFEGRVVDADSKEPIGDALVWCSWSFVRGVGEQVPESVRTAETRTNPDGRYQIDKLRDFPSGLSTRLSRFTLVIYRRGYVAYRHDRIFGGIRNKPRRDFAQVGNRVNLTRWSPEMSHARHLLFVGSSRPLHLASKWEATLAAAQLDGKVAREAGGSIDMIARPRHGQPTSRPSSAGVASKILTSDDVRSVTGFTGAFSAGQLNDPGDTTDTMHLRAVDRSERYDVALRFWRIESPANLDQRYETLLGSLPGSKQVDKIADRSFTAEQGEISAIGFMHRIASTIVLVICGKGQCTDSDHLLKLARVIEKRLVQLSPGGKL